MLSAQEEAYILSRAYIPEHCIRLMTFVSGGEPLLIDDFFICRKENWIILIGYPLTDNFTCDALEAVFSKIKKNIAPRIYIADRTGNAILSGRYLPPKTK